jgi:pimeloyl-ACP methyl ester carboxylesterase
MKVFNLHGYQGSAQNAACTAWQSLGCTVVSPALDYDAEQPAALLDRMEAEIAAQQPDLICGTSLGGFFAAVLAARTGLPVYLVNPCMLPFLHLPRLGFAGPIAPFVPLFGELAALDPDRVRVIVGGSDELIDTHDFTAHFVGQNRVTVIPGGKHSGATLPLAEFFAQAMDN